MVRCKNLNIKETIFEERFQILVYHLDVGVRTNNEYTFSLVRKKEFEVELSLIL